MSYTHNPERPWLFSRLFNPWRCSSNKNSRLLVSEVIKKFLQVEIKKNLRRRKRKPEDHKRFLKAIEAIICDLIHNHLSDQISGIAISRSNRVLSRTSRYKNEVLNKTIPYLLDVLVLPELQMLEQVVGCINYFYPEKNGNLRTVVKAGKHLVHLIQKYHVELEDLGLSDGEETIILKREKNDLWDHGGTLEYKDNDLTNLYRHKMSLINQWIRNADLNYMVPFNEKDKHNYDLDSRLLKRYFTRGSFKSGGRLFGGFWQQMKKVHRENLLIDGDEIVSLDYSQMSPKILYGYCGLVPEMGDCYHIKGYEYCRKGIKKVFNAMTFSNEPMTRFPKGINSLFPVKTRFKDVSDAIENEHSGIGHMFYTGIGHYLQFLESQILVEVLLKLIDNGITALPVHDAVFVGWTHVYKSTQVMEQVFLDMTNVPSVVKVE
jgi:hypothetical protein